MSDFTTQPADLRAAHGGIQRLYQFPNGYGASVIQNEFSYGGGSGLWELAVLEGGMDGEIVYDTPVTDNVLGHLTSAEVERYLAQIAWLTEEEVARHRRVKAVEDARDDLAAAARRLVRAEQALREAEAAAS